jgi:hypothetical protein
VSPVKYELGFYIPEDAILHSHRRENIKSYTAALDVSLTRYHAVTLRPTEHYIRESYALRAY